MADTSKGVYTFLSYARRGAVTGIKDVDDPTKRSPVAASWPCRSRCRG